MKKPVALLWFRRDLRLCDHPALEAAMASGLPIRALYLYDPDGEGLAAPGAAARWYLHHSLLDLQARLAGLGIPLDCLRGNSLGLLVQQARLLGARQLYFNRVPEPGWQKLELEIIQVLSREGVETQAFDGGLFFPPGAVRKADGTAYRVFTAFARAIRPRLEQIALQPLIPASGKVSKLAVDPGAVARLDLLDPIPWHQCLHAHWKVGEAAALERLEWFIEHRLKSYPGGRDIPGEDGTSRLSPALHWGEISLAAILCGLRPALSGLGGVEVMAGAEKMLSEVLWREFAYHVLNDVPDSPVRSLHHGYESLWCHDPVLLQAWQRGETGIALVDAGMRELWETGWMHNRVRMVAASFLTKNLGQHWREGAAWFRDTLVDADLASNTLGWQWVAGCGVDAAPYYRIFNPDTQAKRFDPDGVYIRRWLGDRPARKPIIDLASSRAEALLRFRNRVDLAK